MSRNTSYIIEHQHATPTPLMLLVIMQNETQRNYMRPFAIPLCWRNHHICAPVSCLTFWSLPRLRHDRRHQLPEANTFDLKMFYMISNDPLDQVCQEVVEHGESQDFKDFMTQQYKSYKPHFNVLHCFALSGSLLSGKCRAAHAAAAFKEPPSKTTP